MNDSRPDLPYRIHALELGPMENFIYVVEDIASRRAAVVDPAWEPEEILALAQNKGLTITDLLLTHSHHDHINGIERVLESAPTARLHLLKPEAEFWGRALARPELHYGGDALQIGDTEIRFLHTPGHTPGSACFHLPAGDDLITGDTLFVFGCGRCDLAGGDPEQMFHTLKDLRTGLPPGRTMSKRFDAPIPILTWCPRFSSTAMTISSPVSVSMTMISSPGRRDSDSMACSLCR
jgi:hydroxyacylglutathione hydrolase